MQHFSTHVVSDMTPYEHLHGQKPSISHFMIFGSSAWVHLPRGGCIISHIQYTTHHTMVGYSESFQGGCNPYALVTHRATEHHEVIFDETIPRGFPRSLPSLLSSDDYWHVNMENASSSLAKLFVDDFHLVLVDLTTSSLSLGVHMGTFSSSSFG